MKVFEISGYNAETIVYNNRKFYLLPSEEGLQKANRGELKEYSLRIALTGEQLYYKDSSNHLNDSDIKVNDKNISVKSAEASIGYMPNEDIESYIESYINNDYSNTYMYVTESYKVYEFNKKEMIEFLKANTRISRTKNKRTGEEKLECRLKKENTINNWLINL